MGFADLYLAKHYENIVKVSVPPDKDLQIIVIIPAYNEPHLDICLNSLYECYPSKGKVEVLILINWSEITPSHVIQNSLKQYKSIQTWINEHVSDFISFHLLLYPDMPAKTAGVGLARKTLMDEAVRRFNLLNHSSGIIASFDADTLCEKNYLAELEKHFEKHPLTDGCVIYFEHPVEGDEFKPEVYKAISLYELHLRYYLQSIRTTGFSNAFHTIGSCFAVKALSYCKQGGMNKRKAGEDFYFLKKFFELGNFTELKTTCLIPSPRPSLRVPFGTGVIINGFKSSGKEELLTWNPVLFAMLTALFQRIPELYSKKKKVCTNYLLNELAPPLQEFLKQEDFNNKLMEINSNSSSFISFEKRFYRWFNLFKILKFLNFGKKWEPDIPVTIAAYEYLKKKGLIKNTTDMTAIQLLEIFRSLEKV